MTSVQFNPLGDKLAIGTNKGTVQIWDSSEAKLIRTMKGHKGRVGSLSWGKVLASGSRDRNILFRDVR